MFEVDDERIARSLTFPQIKVLRALDVAKTPIEGFALVKDADSSFEDMYDLGHKGLLDPGFDRLVKNSVHPLITERGRAVLRVIGTLTEK